MRGACHTCICPLMPWLEKITPYLQAPHLQLILCPRFYFGFVFDLSTQSEILFQFSARLSMAYQYKANVSFIFLYLKTTYHYKAVK